MSHGASYLVGYDVAATSRLDAVTKAVLMLRQGVRLTSVYRIDETMPGHWHVTLSVWEDA